MISALKNKKALIAIGTVAVATAGYFGLSSSKNTPEYAPSQFDKIHTISKGSLQQKVSLTGQAKIVNEQKMRFNRSGKIRKVYFSIGDSVKKGDVIAQMDDSEAWSQIKRNQINYRNTYRQLQKISDKTRNTEAINNKSNLSDAEKNLAKAQKDLLIIIGQKGSETKGYFYKFQEMVNNIQKSFDSIQTLYEDQNNPSSFLKTTFGNKQLSSRPIAQAKIELSKVEFEKIKNKLQSLSAHSVSPKQLLDFSYQLEQYADHQIALAQALQNVSTYTKNETYNTVSDTDLQNLSSVSSRILSDAQQLKSQSKTLHAELVKYEPTAQGFSSEKERLKREEIERLKTQLQVSKNNLSESISNNKDQIANTRDNLSLQALEIQRSKKGLEQYKIRAPFDGIIRQLDYKNGDNIVSDDQKFIIVEDPEKVEINASLDQLEVVKTKPGQPVNITFDALPGKKFTGKVSHVSSTPAGGTNRNGAPGGSTSYPVRISVDKSEVKIFSGLQAKLEIILMDKKDIILVPNIALHNKSEKTAFVKRPNTQEMTEIQIGTQGKQSTEVVSGLKVGDKIIEVNLNQIGNTKPGSSFEHMSMDEY